VWGASRRRGWRGDRRCGMASGCGSPTRCRGGRGTSGGRPRTTGGSWTRSGSASARGSPGRVPFGRCRGAAARGSRSSGVSASVRAPAHRHLAGARTKGATATRPSGAARAGCAPRATRSWPPRPDPLLPGIAAPTGIGEADDRCDHRMSGVRADMQRSQRRSQRQANVGDTARERRRLARSRRAKVEPRGRASPRDVVACDRAK
jgi:hypothetical protein